MISHHELCHHLNYDPLTGVWTWQVPTSNKVRRGDVAHTKANECGHLEIRIHNTRYRLHRLAWFYMTKEWPRLGIDHINCDPTDNRFVNLREANQSQNSANSRRSKNNTSGVKGVHWNGVGQKWRASIMYQRRKIHIGRYSRIEDAKAAYLAKAKELFGEFARAE